MDYCSECRRHLNGALVCPGCGAYAPDIAPPGTGGSPAGTTGTEVAPPTWEFESAANPFPGDPAAVAGTSADVEDAPPMREGRAARRRQLARWKKNQRRAVVATAVALVGGGLTLASMDRHTADRAQAATLPDDRNAGTAPQDEAPDQAPGPSATPATHPAHHVAPAPRTPGGTGPVQRTPATHHGTTPPDTHPDSAAPATPVTRARPATTRPAHTTAPSTPATGRTTSPAPSTSSTPAPAPTPGGSGQGTTSSTPPARASTSPEQLCVLVLCIG
ncbi:SCO2400 family protein [Streptomyces sp. LaBMicrA B280]|uniref:SCO2400 family protein n=1 Tax=Streptomyces sp. LaBMicrA B280 TaxID=3391001 RepID=UPI003BA4000A